MRMRRLAAAVGCATLGVGCSGVLGLGDFENVCADGRVVGDHAECTPTTGGGGPGGGGSGPGGGGSGGCAGATCKQGDAVWAQRFGDALQQEGNAIAADASGNVFVAGTFQGAVQLGGPTFTSAGGDDVLLAKLDGNGNHVASKRFGDSNGQRATAVAVDASGNVGIAGSFSGTIALGGPVLQTAGALDVFVAKLGPNLSHVWSQSFGGPSNQHVGGMAFAGSDLVVAGSFEQSIDFGSGAQASAGGLDVFVARLDSDGGIVWAKTFGGSGNEAANAVAVDSAGRTIVTGTFDGTVNFGDGALVSQGANDVFLVVLDTTGGTVWSLGYGDADEQSSAAVAVDSAGNIVVAGTFAGAMNFGLGTIQSHGATDAFVAKLDSAGGEVWRRQGGDAAAQTATGAAVGADGDVLVAGGFEGSIDFGGESVTSAGGEDVFLAKLDASGAPVWIRSAGDTGIDQRAAAVAIDPAGNALVTGHFDGTLTFGQLPTLSSAGQTDGFVVKLSP